MNRIVRLGWGLSLWVALLAASLTSSVAAQAADQGKGDAKRLYEEATAAFGLGRYAEAAQRYEGAFALKPDPALLYDAAQAYRLAGNKVRALELYRNYLRLYPDRSNADDARNHVAALRRAIEDEREPSGMATPAGMALVSNPAFSVPRPPPPPPVVKSAPPPVVQAPFEFPPAVAPAPAAAPLPAPVIAGSTAVAPPARPSSLLSAPSPDADVSVTHAGSNPPRDFWGHHTWLWVAGGAAVVLLGAVVIVAASGGGSGFHDPTLGTANGN